MTAMKITVFGASGGIGEHVVAFAAHRGHDVRAVYRTRPGVAPGDGVRPLVHSDIFDPDFAAAAVRGADVVISAMGPNFTRHHHPRSTLTSPKDLHEHTARTIVTALRTTRTGARLIAVSTGSMGPADAVMGPVPRTLFRFMRGVVIPNLGLVGRDLVAMERELTTSGLDWYAVRPVKLTDGPLTEDVRASAGFTMKTVSRADVAYYLVGLAEGTETAPSRTPVIYGGGAPSLERAGRPAAAGRRVDGPH